MPHSRCASTQECMDEPRRCRARKRLCKHVEINGNNGNNGGFVFMSIKSSYNSGRESRTDHWYRWANEASACRHPNSLALLMPCRLLAV
jgi:hypothetical protein